MKWDSIISGADMAAYPRPRAERSIFAIWPLMKVLKGKGTSIISTGMSTLNEIKAALEIIGEDNLILCHTTSSYPCPPEELNLRMVQTQRDMTTTCPIGYSGHEVGLVPSAVAVALGACLVERHITLDRAMWGSDQSASVEPQGLASLVKYIRVTERSLGDGIKRVYDSELSSLSKLRRFSQ